MSQLRVYKDRKKEWRWTLIHSNGRKLANGGEGYKHRRDLLKVVAGLFPWYRVKSKALERATDKTYWALTGRDV